MKFNQLMVVAMQPESEKSDAICHRKRIKDHRLFNSYQKKVFFGDDVLSKMALLSQQLTGKKLNVKHVDSELLADVINSCINYCYNEFFDKNGLFQQEPSSDTPKITAPMSPKGQQKYRLYQRIKGRFDKLNTGDSDEDKWLSIANLLLNAGIKKPKGGMFSKGPVWSKEDIKWILTPENINSLIHKNNEKYKLERDALNQKRKPKLML